VAVKPKTESGIFFKHSYECQSKVIGNDPCASTVIDSINLILDEQLFVRLPLSERNQTA
jgi:hypothetical protein